jgi:hypothetical protein
MQRWMVIALLVTFPVLAQAQTMPAPGHLPPDSYPTSACVKPNRNTIGTPDFTDTGQAGYNTRVRSFNAQATAFNACIKAYVDKAQADIAQIQALVHDAVAEETGPERA